MMKINNNHNISLRNIFYIRNQIKSTSFLLISLFPYLISLFSEFTKPVRNLKYIRSFDRKSSKFGFATVRIQSKILFLLTIVIIFTISPPSSFSRALSVPADFIMRLVPPGSNNDFLRPSDIFIDKYTNEVLVTDPGKNRIMIFDSTGTFSFEFEGADYFSTPTNIVVDSEGYIFILGSTKNGSKLFKFDFDGLFIKEFQLSNNNNVSLNPTCLTIENDILYIYDRSTIQISSFDRDGNFIQSIEILNKLEDIVLKELVISSITVQNEKIYIPVSTLGKIYIYELDGTSLNSIGRKGNNVGQLNFPVEVKLLHNEILMVLDKHRTNVVCYDLNGKFLGEFGGKGSSPGWFYHPTLLEVNNQHQVYIGQIFNNKIQLCQIPQFITEKIEGK